MVWFPQNGTAFCPKRVNQAREILKVCVSLKQKKDAPAPPRQSSTRDHQGLCVSKTKYYVHPPPPPPETLQLSFQSFTSLESAPSSFWEEYTSAIRFSRSSFAMTMTLALSSRVLLVCLRFSFSSCYQKSVDMGGDRVSTFTYLSYRAESEWAYRGNTSRMHDNDRLGEGGSITLTRDVNTNRNIT